MVVAVEFAQDVLTQPQLAYHPRQHQLGDVFEVVGGKENGGIKVREGKDVSSPEVAGGERLATGARVRALDVATGGRLRYELVHGSGPATGWVSLRVQGKDLLVNLTQSVEEQKPLQAHEQAVLLYGQRIKEALSEVEEAKVVLQGGRHAFPLYGKGKVFTGGHGFGAANMQGKVFALDIATDAAEQESEKKKASGEEVLLCKECCLPLGMNAYTSGGKKKAMMHGECMAQHMLREMREEEKKRKQKEAELKQSRRAEYEIGWHAGVVPSNVAAAEKLNCGIVPQGMCCLALVEDEASGDITVAVRPTLEPGAAVNLEYLSIALQVRRREGREPLFSLDPIDPARTSGCPEGSMQEKRFEPEWLAGTSLGEVMFQADYHLKELSMGEYEQPVLGMRSCFDYSKEEGTVHAWSAREWFVVRKAEIHISADQVIVPFLKMGVEAREQFITPEGFLEDVPLTRHDHPLVRYAEAFTQNFELISERKSVVHQLREVAKASVLAKYLLESGAQLEESWFNLTGSLDAPCCLEVPQLWNDRFYTEVQVHDGKIKDTLREEDKTMRHGVYGGVDFGIDRFRLAAPSRVAASVVGGRVALGAPSSTLMAASQQRLALGTERAFTRLAGPMAPSAMSMAPSRVASSLGVPQRLAAPVSGMSMAAGLRAPSGSLSMSSALRAPQGVDLSLDQFNLSAPIMAGGEVQSQDPDLKIGSSFWSSLTHGARSGLTEEDKGLLRDVFNPHLSDRREEGEEFQPPPTGSSYLQKLKELLEAEQDIKHRRREHFLSANFAQDDAGPLFPASWTSTFQGQAASGNAQGGMLQVHDYRTEEAALVGAIRNATPAFDRFAEDGTRYRIYRFGSLEVRTVQEHDGEEEIGVVFSVRSSMTAWGGKWNRSAKDTERIVKATEYVEAKLDGRHGHRLYVVLETEEGHSIVTEKLPDGMATWQENPQDLENRNSLAKVIRTRDSVTNGVSVGELKGYQMKETRSFGVETASPEKCVRYAQIVYSHAVGKTHGYTSGFMKRKQLEQQAARPRRTGDQQHRQ